MVTDLWQCVPMATAWLVCWSFYVLATFKVISGWVLTWNSVHSWWIYSADPLGYPVNVRTIILYPTQSHYPDPEPTSPCSTLIMSSTRLWSDKVKCLKSLVWLDREDYAHLIVMLGDKTHNTNIALWPVAEWVERPLSVLGDQGIWRSRVRNPVISEIC